MDATAAGGGPSTILPTIVTGSPQQIAAMVMQRMRQAQQFLQIIQQLQGSAQQLSQVWTGSASQAATQKIMSTVAAFQKIVSVIQAGSKMLGTAGTLVGSAQAGYTGVVSAVNPTVAGLMSNPFTYNAAVALSTSTSSTLKAFTTGIQGALQGLGAGQLMGQVSMLMQIIQEIEQLSKSGGSSAGTLPNLGSIATPIAAPVTPPPVATALGQQVAAAAQNSPASGVFTSYTPAALTGFGTNGARSTPAS
jgi:hypothetical protein